MKIIDLLNKIANREEVPYKILYKNIEYYYIGGSYEDEEGRDLCSYYYSCSSLLNDEVEILEEKKIPEKLSTWFSLEQDCENDNIQYANHNFKTMYEKINEICVYLKSKGDE